MKSSTQGRAAVVLLASALAGCGGSGSDNQFLGSSSSSSTSPCPVGVSACSGNLTGTALGPVRLTTHGVQTIAISTSDLRPDNADTTEAHGLRPSAEGMAEIRILRDSQSQVSALDLLLSGLKLSWDGKTERPLVIENFKTGRGRVQLGSQGMSTLVALPPKGDPFWDNDPVRFTGTQNHYANNHYVERTPPACREGDSSCLAAAANGLRLVRGNWTSGGLRPHQVDAARLHEDGATQAPDDIPYAGFKGYRDLWNWNYQYANLAGWITKDTIGILEWGGGSEHNKERRGTLAYGELTAPTAIPSNGSVTYTGYVRGWYSPNGTGEAFPIAADVSVTVDFAKKQAQLQLRDMRIDEYLPPEVDPAIKLAANSTNLLPFGSPQNTAIGPVVHGDVAGQAGLRFFGPATPGMPPEIAGTFSLLGSSGTAAIGGFIARRPA